MRTIEVSADGGNTWICAGEKGTVRIVDTPEDNKGAAVTTSVSLTNDHCIIDREQLGLRISTSIKVDELSTYASKAAAYAVTASDQTSLFKGI